LSLLIFLGLGNYADLKKFIIDVKYSSFYSVETVIHSVPESSSGWQLFIIPSFCPWIKFRV